MLRAMFTLAVAVAAGQQQASPPDSGDGVVFRSDARVVVCHTTVVGKDGTLITGLPRSAFAVYENGVRQQITGFQQEDVPVSMGLLVDNSGSMRFKREKVEAADLALVGDSNPDDEVFIVNFADQAFLDLPDGEDFTSNIAEMKEALRRTDSRGETAMRDAIEMSLQHLDAKAHRDKKVLVVVTDGEDNVSVTKMEDLVRHAQQSGDLIYCVGLLRDEDPLAARRARRALQELASATGGQAFFPDDVSQVDRIAHLVAHDIRNQYTISYTPSNSAMDGAYREIKIAVDAPGKPDVRTRSGYFATPAVTRKDER